MSEDARPNRFELRYWIYISLLTVWSGLVIASIWQAEPLMSANDRSRWATVRALVEDRSYVVNRIVADDEWDSIDKVLHKYPPPTNTDEEWIGNFYSSKPPLLSTMVAGVSLAVTEASGWRFDRQTNAVISTTLILVNWLPMLLAMLSLVGVLERFAGEKGTRFTVLITALFGTYLTPFLTTLNNHVPATIATCFAMAALMRILDDAAQAKAARKINPESTKSARWRDFIILGLGAAFACSFELPAALFGIATCFVAAVVSFKKTLLAYAPCALLPLAAFFVTNYLATGGVMPFYAGYGTELYNFTIDGVPSYWSNPTGIDRSTESAGVYLFHCLVGHHGIYSLSPIFLLTLIGWLAVPLWAAKSWRAAMVLGFVMTVGVLAFYLTRTANYNYGGNTAALRWCLWPVPMWLIAMIPLCDRLVRGTGFRAVTTVLLIVSVFSVSYSLTTPWRANWLFDLMTEHKLIDYSDPPLAPLATERKTWLIRLPDPPAGEQVTVTLSGPDALGETHSLELTAFPRVQRGARQFLPIRVIVQAAIRWELRCEIDIAQHGGGASPKDFVIFDDAVDQPDRLRLLRLFAGGPNAETFQPSYEGYLFTSLRRDAFACRVDAATIRTDDSDFVHQCGVWSTDDDGIPFGVVQVQFSVRDRGTGSGWSRMRYRVVSVTRE